MRDLRLFALSALLLVSSAVVSTPAAAIDLTGVWATDAGLCTKIFIKKDGQLAVAEMSDLYGGGFIFETDRIWGKAARCTIKSRNEDAAMLSIQAACATDIMTSNEQFSLKVNNDNSISRVFPGMPGMEVTYYRCQL